MGEIRFVGPGKTRGYPYLVCKKQFSTPRFTLRYKLAITGAERYRI